MIRESIDEPNASKPITQDVHERIRAHYARAMPWLERHFGGTPLIAVTFPQGFAGNAVFHESFAHLPATIETIDAATRKWHELRYAKKRAVVKKA